MKQIAFLLCLPLALAAGPIWQLGTPDDSAAEFYSALNQEFKTDPLILKSPDYNPKTRTFRYRVAAGVTPRPQMPGGVAGDNALNNSIVTTQILEWTEEKDGWRRLSLRLLPGYQNLQERNANCDIDGTDVPFGGLRIAAPGNRLFYTMLPNDLAKQLRKTKKPCDIAFSFPVKKGKNTLILQETSGQTYHRCYFFDYLKLSESGPAAETPVVEQICGKNFPAPGIYVTGSPADMQIRFYNLGKGTCSAETVFLDYFGKAVKREQYPVQPDADGFFAKTILCPEKATGHFRVRTKLFSGTKETASHATRIAAVRLVAPLNEKETDENFFGLSGNLMGGLLENDYTPFPKEYFQYRRLLQLRYERLHWLSWYVVEREEGKRDWAYFDKIVDTSFKDGVRLQLDVMGTPDWMLKKHGVKFDSNIWNRWLAVPPDMDAFAAFCADAAKRYRGKISEIEIWNEISEHSMFWPNGNAKQYLEMLEKCSKAIRAAAPELKIASQTLWARQNIFVHSVFAGGAAKWVDSHLDHYLTDDRIAENIAILRKYGLKPCFISNEDRLDSPSDPCGQINEESRRKAVNNLVRNTLYQASHGVKRCYNFLLNSKAWRMWGMIGPDNTPKYTYPAYKMLFNRLAGSRIAGYRRLSKSAERFDIEYFSPVRSRENGGDFAVALTNTGTEPFQLFLPCAGKSFRCVDVMDNQHEIPAENGLASVTVMPDSPVFLYGIDRQRLALADSLKIIIPPQDPAPGTVYSLRAELPEGNAEIAVRTPFSGKKIWRIAAGQSNRLAIPVPKDLPNGSYPVIFDGKIISGKNVVPFRKEQNLMVEDKKPGTQLLPPLSGNHWVRWGKGEPSYQQDSMTLTVPANEVGAVRNIGPISVIPGGTYSLSFKAHGNAVLHVMTAFSDRNGKQVKLNHNQMLQRLEAQTGSSEGRFQVPENAAKLILHFYIYKEKSVSSFTLSDCRLIRIQPQVPLMRQLVRAKAAYCGDIRTDGKLDEWKKEEFYPIEDAYGKKKDISAEFAARWNEKTLFLAVRVKDKVHFNPYATENVWQGDSVQFAMEPSYSNAATTSVRLALARCTGGLYGCYHETIPVPELIPEYSRGPVKSGLRFEVLRKDGYTYYEAAIPTEKLKPSLLFPKQGKSVAFSILVNNNDGQGRSCIGWGDGIAREMSSLLFGTLELEPEK